MMSNQTLFSDRILQYKYAYITLMEQPFFGFGLNNYSYINDNLTPYHLQSEHIISAHNGYLAVLVQYGLIFGFLVLGIIFYNGFLLIRDYKKYPNHLFYLYMLIYTLIAALYESLFTGVNDFHTNIFWLSLCILLSLKYNINNAD